MPEYTLYVNNNLIHTCHDWFEAHGLNTQVYGIEEWNGLPIYTALDGVPLWGITPDKQKEPATKRRLGAIRSHYLRKTALSEQERETAAQAKLAALVTDIQAQLAQLLNEKR